jgi:predicted CXXCH cytochrome family protein
MRKYNPSMRVDQYREYLTSVHGKQWKKGDPNVAVCTDCHTSHKILGADNPQSTIYPTNVPKTCAKCHSNKTLMKKYNLPTNQFDLYAQSVHGEALFKKNDISAPTCNDCHGNHGAIPPGIRNIAEVCGQCHVVQSNEFSAGPHKAIFDDIGEPGCVTCHSNHKINVLTDKNILDPETSVCSNCHDDGDAGFEANKQIADAILYLSSNYERLQKKIDKAKMTGLSLDKPVYELQGLRDLLIKSRVVIHRMHPSGVLELKKKGEKIVKKVDDSIEKVITDYYNRKRGLYISLIFIVLVVIGLYLYMRERFQE